MASTTVHSIRKLKADIDAVWGKLRDFDLNWHPHVDSCKFLRSANGTLIREFTDTQGGSYREERTYVSNSDRVLCYRLTRGIDGILSYNARVELTREDDGSTAITWHADIAADSTRLDAICAGTKAIFEAGFDALETVRPAKPARRIKAANKPAAIVRHQISGCPELSYLQSGDTGAVPVVFLHGIGGRAENWTRQLAHLGEKHTAIAMDLRGFGQSTLGFEQSQIDDYCEDILQIANRANSEKLVLVGLSFGSWVATSFAMRHADRLAGLVLAGGCTGMSEADARERENFRISRTVPLDEGQRPADFAPAVVEVIAGPNASDADRASLRDSMEAIPPETYRDALNCFCNPLEKFSFARITCPVLLMTGEHDRLAPPEEIRRVSERIADAPPVGSPTRDVRFEVIADAGHVCNLEQTEAFNAVLSQFLTRLPHVCGDYKPTPAEKQHAKRDRIIAAAHEEFCQHGFDGASMDRLAEAAGVSKPTLYQYFGDKEGLFAAVLDVGRQHLIAPLASKDGTLVERLWGFSWTYAEFVLRPDMLSLARLILGEAARRPESAIAYHKAGPGKAFDGIAEFIRDCVADGSLRTQEPELAAHDLWGLILSGPRDHYLHNVTTRPDPEHLAQSIGHGLKVFLTVYSTNPDHDLGQLETLRNVKNREIGKERIS